MTSDAPVVTLAELYARRVLQGFHTHYTRFLTVTEAARERFAKGQWQAGQAAASERISFYDQRVNETIEVLRGLTHDEFVEADWLAARRYYQAYLTFHPQAELAETFYNSVFCSLFHRRYYNNAFIFVETTLEQGRSLPLETEFRSYFPVLEGMRRTLLRIFTTIDFGGEFADLDDDIRRLREAFRRQTSLTHTAAYELRIDVLKTPFYRNKAAYLVGRIVTETGKLPFVVAVLRRDDGSLYLDALITDAVTMAVLFGFARSYFMVSTHVPSALVSFLQELMPTKTRAELYSSIGLHKQSKTEFYRDFLNHLQASHDQLIAAPGIKGLVMTVFTLPSFPYVFKIIKDRFGAGKSIDRQTVIDRYRMVKQHDRAGRMADTYEFVDVVIPRHRLSDALYQELSQTARQSIREEGDMVVIKHLFVERRMTPLNIYLEQATPAQAQQVIVDYGHAIKDMIAANIFPGDMLIKNFGVTRHQRVVFYDYDEVQYLAAMTFRQLPTAETGQGYATEDYSVASNDVFPQQIPTFALANPEWRALFLQAHPELVDVDYWQTQQKNISHGIVTDVFPYPASMRLR